ncbi:hypothetical protein SLA2020_400000 [Shorea laevis]
MSDSKSNSSDGAGDTLKRNLPSWMSSRGSSGSKSRKKPNDAFQNKEITGSVRAQSGKGEPSRKPSAPSSNNTDFSKLLEGVVFVLSGFVNPERSTLRSHGLEMGAEYRADWDSNCTLLVCAFQNTPKFRQVEADCGTIVSKEWILECYSQKKLVDIDPYLMNAGKPWRKSSIPHETSQDKKESPRKSNKQVEKGSKPKPNSVLSKDKETSHPDKESFSYSQVKKWAIDDFKKTTSWLESQDEKANPSEIKHIAAEGILTCLQDAIDALEQKQDIRQVTEQWNFIPHVVEELLKLDGTHGASLSKEDLCKKAKAFKQIYEDELSRLDDNSSSSKRKRKFDKGEGVAGYDSDKTIEMTEEEIDHATKNTPPIVWMK